MEMAHNPITMSLNGEAAVKTHDAGFYRLRERIKENDDLGIQVFSTGQCVCLIFLVCFFSPFLFPFPFSPLLGQCETLCDMFP